MTHLTDEQLYNLADLTVEMQPYSEEELVQMGHLKDCEICYNKFCAARAILEVTSESGYAVLSEIYSEKAEKECCLNESVLAVLRVVRSNLENQAVTVIEQIKQLGTCFQFAPQLAFATRGAGDKKQSIYKMEDIEDEKTFVVFDTDKNELLIQINTRDLEYEDIKVSLVFEKGQNILVPVIRKGKFVKGSLENIPEMNFEIRVETENL